MGKLLDTRLGGVVDRFNKSRKSLRGHNFGFNLFGVDSAKVRVHILDAK
jgi:hypothetical protein